MGFPSRPAGDWRKGSHLPSLRCESGLTQGWSSGTCLTMENTRLLCHTHWSKEIPFRIFSSTPQGGKKTAPLRSIWHPVAWCCSGRHRPMCSSCTEWVQSEMQLTDGPFHRPPNSSLVDEKPTGLRRGFAFAQHLLLGSYWREELDEWSLREPDVGDDNICSRFRNSVHPPGGILHLNHLSTFNSSE